MGWMFAFLLVAYAGVCVFLAVNQRRLMYFPDRRLLTPAEAGLEDFRSVTVRTTDGLLLTGWFKAPLRSDRPTIVHFHGNAGQVADRATIARLLTGAGYGVFLVGYRGYGGNPGEPTEAGLLDDGRSVLDWLTGQGISGQGVVLFGESLGTGIAVKLAVERRVRAVILEAPYTSITDVAAAHYPWLPVRLLLRDRFDSAAVIQDVTVPLLVVHGERDTVVPARFGRALFAKATGPKQAVWLPEAGHSDLLAHGAGDAILAFLAGPRADGAVIDQTTRRGTALVPRP